MTTSLGKYYDQAKAGRVFIGSTLAAGTTIPVDTATAQKFGLWNTSSVKNAVLLRLTLAYASGTIALGTFGWMEKYAGFAIGTGSPISAFTNSVLGTTHRNALVGSGGASAMRFTPSAATVAAGTGAMWFGTGTQSATVAVGPVVQDFDFDGNVIVPPGVAVFLVGSLDQTALYTCSLWWAEVDI